MIVPTLTSSLCGTSRRWPEVNFQQIEVIAEEGQTLASLREKSPVRFDTVGCHAEKVIDALFPENPLLCCGANKYYTPTRPRNCWRGRLHEMQFIVPSAMKAPEGKTLKGKLSPRSADNTGPRRFLIIEFDFQEKSKNDSATALTPVPQRLRRAGLSAEKKICSVHAPSRSAKAQNFAKEVLAKRPRESLLPPLLRGRLFQCHDPTWRVNRNGDGSAGR